jgi:hypothetical protein
VGDDEWERCWADAALVDEVDRDVVDGGEIVAERVHFRLVAAPVVAGAPVVDDLLEVGGGHAVAPVVVREVGGPSHSIEPLGEVDEPLLRHGDREGRDSRWHVVRSWIRSPAVSVVQRWSSGSRADRSMMP